MTTMRIAEVAERTGVPATTLRYYDEIGLLAPAGRSGNGYREYADRDLERLAFITRAKQLDISLDELRELVEVWDDDCGQVQHRMTALVAGRIAQTQARITDLVQLTAQLHAAAVRLSSAPVSDRACGDDCACMAGDDAIPVACSLEHDLARSRMAEWQHIIAQAADRHTTADGVVLSFVHDVGLTTEIARLAAAEFECCSFFRFGITVDASGVRLEIGAPPEARDVLTALVGSPAS